MSTLQKATLQEISSDEKDSSLGDPVPVQFNPTTLKLQISNSVEGGDSRGRQTRQYIGSSSTTLSLDLIFDTADEGTDAVPVSVLERTAMVEKFLLPKGDGNEKQVPPRVRFHWGRLIVDGVIDSLTIDLDHFAADGTPLRAKASLAIKEQNRKYELLEAGPGANKGAGSPAPGQATPGAPGSVGVALSASAQASLAIGGEAAADFAARVGLDPTAWRGLSLDGGDSLSLTAGAEIGFSADLSISAGLGVSVGVSAGASASLEVSFGLEVDASLSAVAGVGVGADLAAGFALTAAGGVSAALATVQTAQRQASADQQRQAFVAPAAGASPAAAPQPQPGPPEQPRAPLAQTGLPSPAAQQAAQPAPPPPRVDPRAASFGFGLPLRTGVGSAAAARADVVAGRGTLRPHATGGDPPTTTDPTTPPWVALPATGTAGPAAAQRRTPCRCRGCCHCRGG